MRISDLEFRRVLFRSDLRKTYSGPVEALKGISLSVAPGDFFALLGPNGAGKSTLIGIVSSLVNASSGSVRVFGEEVAQNRSAAMRLLGLVPQEINFNLFERSEEHTSELQSLMRISYAVFCLKKKKKHNKITCRKE